MSMDEIQIRLSQLQTVLEKYTTLLADVKNDVTKISPDQIENHSITLLNEFKLVSDTISLDVLTLNVTDRAFVKLKLKESRKTLDDVKNALDQFLTKKELLTSTAGS